MGFTIKKIWDFDFGPKVGEFIFKLFFNKLVYIKTDFEIIYFLKLFQTHPSRKK